MTLRFRWMSCVTAVVFIYSEVIADVQSTLVCGLEVVLWCGHSAPHRPSSSSTVCTFTALARRSHRELILSSVKTAHFKKPVIKVTAAVVDGINPRDPSFGNYTGTH